VTEVTATTAPTKIITALRMMYEERRVCQIDPVAAPDWNVNVLRVAEPRPNGAEKNTRGHHHPECQVHFACRFENQVW
jgi:hypothetical protein